MTTWTEGGRCRIVEIDGATMRPRENGAIFEATVTKVGKSYVRAKTREPEFDRTGTFYRETNLTQWWQDGSGWRLMPETDENDTAAGEDTPR